MDGGAVDALGPPLLDEIPVGFEARLCVEMRLPGPLQDSSQFLVRWQCPRWVEPASRLGLLTQHPERTPTHESCGVNLPV